MERARAGNTGRAEELLRSFAAALNAVRLYPPTSPLRGNAISRFVGDANELSAQGPLNFGVDRQRFLFADTTIGETLPQVAALAETLHALQVGQLIIAPGLMEPEVAAFLDVISGDAAAIRASGGVRQAALNAHVENLAVIEVSLRASDEAGLLGLDLTKAPLEEVAAGLKDGVTEWRQAAGSEDARPDAIAEAVGRLEPAARDLALRRCAEALLLLDEASRLEMMAAALPGTEGAPPMEGMLEAVGHMQPAALARLLRLLADMRQEKPDSLLKGLELPPEIAKEIAALLKPSPQSEDQRGIPREADVKGIAAEVAAADEEDMLYLDMLVADTTARAAAARGLATTLQIVRERRTEDAIRSVADALRPAIREGAITELSEAADLLREMELDPALAAAARAAQTALHDHALLESCARRLADDPSSDLARSLIEGAGAAGAEALLNGYLGANEMQRAHLLPTMIDMIDTVAPVAGRILRSGDAPSAIAMLRLLGSMESRRLLPIIAAGLEHLDNRVREDAVITIAESGTGEGAQLLQRALTHWDPETRRIAAREIGRTKNEALVPALLKIAGEVSLFERNYELKKEVLKSLEAVGSIKAVPVLTRLANRHAVLGRRNRELRYLARRALESIQRPGQRPE